MVTQSPQGLASLGRYGDSMLVHMNPSEVAGLQSLAMAQGGSLTINPQTGLPEAFSLGGFFGSLLPMFAGSMFPAAGFTMAPLLAGAATGAGLAAVKGENPLFGGLMGGLGGISGSNLGYGLMGAANPVVTGGGAPMANILDRAGAATAVDAPMLSQQIGNPALMNATNLARNTGLVGSAGSLDPMINNLSQQASGIGNLVTGKPGAWQGFKNAFAVDGAAPLTNTEAALKIGMPVGGAVIGGLEPSDLYGSPINMASAKSKEAYDPYATLNLGSSSGLRLVAKGGYIDGYAQGGTIASGGIRDLYGRNDDQLGTALSRDGYGIGRLDQLANAEAMNTAKTLGYAMGGPVSFADGGDSNKLTDDAELIDTNLGLTGLSLSRPNTPMQTTSIEQIKKVADTTAPSDGSIVTEVTMALKNDPNYQPKNPIEAAIVKQLKGDAQSTPTQQGLGSLVASRPMAPTYNPSVAMGPTYFAGMNAPRGMARGGYLDGQGDGMSDSIPATIEGKQPARLADGEFVVSADVVSHLGNGSTKAGAKKLYKMMDKVRLARTGTKKQGKQINPDKYLPR